MKLSPATILILSILAGVIVVFVIDPLDSTTLISPFCLGILLLTLSIHQRVWVVLTVCIIYCALDIQSMLYFLRHAPHPIVHPLFWFYETFGLFIVVCLSASYLSYYREQTQRTLNQTREILSKLPSPVAVSDATGYVTYVNDYLCALLGQSSSQLVGKRYVDLFMSDIEAGKAMRYYIDLFGEPNEKLHDLKLRTSSSQIETEAYATCLGSGARRNMVTVLKVP
jgi:PAS domain S-box-containing protein